MVCTIAIYVFFKPIVCVKFLIRCFRILFHFHKNETTHVHAKVSPPRLNGLRTGVLGTRSPHRPSPIGLSLVQIDKVEGKFYISFLVF